MGAQGLIYLENTKVRHFESFREPFIDFGWRPTRRDALGTALIHDGPCDRDSGSISFP